MSTHASNGAGFPYETEGIPRPADVPPDLAALCRTIAERPAAPRLSTGLETLDCACRGGVPVGRRIVLLGAPGAGKTALAVQWAHTWARAGAYVVYLAQDQDPEATLVRLGQREGIGRESLEGVDGSEAKRAAFLDLAERLAGLPLLLLDGADVELETTIAILRAMSGDVRRAIVIDSLQTIRCAAADGKETRRDRIDAILDVLRVASSEGIAVVAVSEMARGAYAGGASTTAALAAAKESGSIEYFADLLLALRSVRGESDLVEVETAKNRLGPKEDLRLRIDYRRAALSEVPRPSAEDASERARASTRAEVSRDAEALAEVLRAHPTGICERELRGALRGAGYKLGVERLTAARAVLVAGWRGVRLMHRSGDRGRKIWFFTPVEAGERDADA